MSLFPRHLRPGDTLTIHLRIAPRPTCFPWTQVTVIDPTGKRVFERTEQLPASIPEPELDEDPARLLAEGLSELPPLLFIAQHLRSDPEQRSAMMNTLREMHRSIHWYSQFRVPDDAALGTYQVETACWVRGKKTSSPTAANDKFFVERVTLAQAIEARGGRFVAALQNHSPSPTPARLHQYRRQDGTLTADVQRVVLLGASVTQLELSSDNVMLAYAEDQGRLWLHGDADPVCVRDQSATYMASRDDSVLVTSGFLNKTFTLTKAAREIWLQASGDMRRSQLRALGAGPFDALCRAGLLREL